MIGRRAGMTALAFAAVLMAPACSAGGSSTEVPTTSANPSDSGTSPDQATAPTGAEAIFEAKATLHPGPTSGGKVPTRVDVAVTNIGIVTASLAGTVSLTDSAGRDYTAATGHPDGLVLDFGTVAPGVQVVRSYSTSIPAGVRITAVVVDSGTGIPVDGPAVTAP